MKKTISLLLALIMLLSIFAACGEKPATDVAPDAGQDTASDTSDAPANSTDEQTEPNDKDKDTTEITPPDAPVVITIDQSLSGSQTPGTQTTAPQTGTPQTQTPQTQTPETQTPATQTPSSQTPSSQTPSGGNETPAQSTTPSQTTAPAAGSQLQQSPAATKAVQLNGAGTRLDTVRASAAKNLQIGIFGDSITTNDTATDFHAMAFEGGYFLPTLGGGTGYYTAYQNLTYNLYECFKWDGTKADSNITSISEARIKKTLDPDSPPLDYYIAAISRDRSLATKDGEGRSLTAYKYLNELLHKQNPNGKLVLIVPPGYQDGCTFYSEKLSMTNMSRAEHNTLIKAFAAKLKEAIPDAIYVEAGDAFEFFIKNYASSGIDLYRTDLRSASEAGSYLIAAILYEKIFGKSVYGMDFDSHLAHEEAVLLQQAAHEFVYGSKPTSSTGHKTATPIQILFDDDPRYKNEVYPKNYDALLATAMAYYDSHIFTQYDQLSPDRVLSSHVFYRRTVDGTGDPEEGTPQKTLYLDCTAFVWALLKSAFNYELPEKRSRPLAYGTSAELKPLVVWENHITADTQIDETIDNFLKTLQPGDVIAYSNPNNDRGHGVIYLGKGYIMQCSSASRFGGGSADYQYTNGSKMDSHETAGGIRVDKIDFMTDPLKLSYQFNPANDMTIRIIRPPYDKMTPTENTQNRVKNMQHIVAYKLTSAPEGVTVNPGDTVDITVVVKNRGTENKTVAVTDTLPSGLTLKSGSNNFSLTVAPGETKSQSYTVQVSSSAAAGSFIDYKTTKAGGVLLNNTPVWVNKTLTADEQKKVVAAAKAASASDSYALCKAAYDAVGITLPFDSAQKAQTNVFTSDPAFSAKKGVKFISSPYSVKYLAAGLWGGLLVTSTENDHRLKYIGYENLVPGDMICVAEGDADKSEPQLYIYLGSHTIMTVKDGKPVTYTSSSACRELLERIWAEVSFYVCRPSLTR